MRSAPLARRRFHLASSALLLCCALVTGCGSADKVDYAQPYPADKKIGPTLDIQIVRETAEVRLTNTTARSFGPCRLWLNQWYTRPIKGFAVGETLVLPLSEFRDRHSEQFRGGGFFASKAPDRLVAAHLETEDQMVALVVVPARDD